MGAVKLGFEGISKLSIIPSGAVHVKVSGSLSGSEEPEPSKVTKSPSSTDWSSPALATGATLTGFTVMTTSSAGESTVPSLTTKENRKSVSAKTSGAVNVGLSTVAELNVIPDGAVH